MHNTKQQLVSAFWHLAETTPIAQIKVKHITAAAHCNRCTFYQYFEDISDLQTYAEDDLLNRVMEDVQAVYHTDISYKQLLTTAAQSFQKYGYYLNILFGANGSLSFQQKYKDRLKPIISSILMQHQIPCNEILTEYAIGGFLSAIRYWQQNPETMQAEELASVIYRLTTHGVFPVR